MVVLVTMICGISVSAYAAEQSYAYQLEEEKAEMLEDVKEQLIAQDAIRFYPIYEKMINDMYTPVTRATKDLKAYFPNGGTIYYANYLNTGVEMMNTYYSDEAYNALINRDSTPSAFVELVAKLTVRLASKSASSLMTAYKILTKLEMNRIKEAGGAYLCVTEDHEGYASAILAWRGHPYATYSSGATVNKF